MYNDIRIIKYCTVKIGLTTLSLTITTLAFILVVLSFKSLPWMHISEPERDTYFYLKTIQNSDGDFDYSYSGYQTIYNTKMLLIPCIVFTLMALATSPVLNYLTWNQKDISKGYYICISFFMCISLIFSIAGISYFRNNWVNGVINNQVKYCLYEPQPPLYCSQFQGYVGNSYTWGPASGFYCMIVLILFNFISLLLPVFILNKYKKEHIQEYRPQTRIVPPLNFPIDDENNHVIDLHKNLLDNDDKDKSINI